MGINMHIKDTWEVTLDDLIGMLPNSKAALQVNKLTAKIEELAAELERYRSGVEVEVEGVIGEDIMTCGRFVQADVGQNWKPRERVRVLVMKEGGDE